LHEVIAYAKDGYEGVTIRWEVTVIPPEDVHERSNSFMPDEPVMYPPSPNPFNSTVNLSFYLPLNEYITLIIYDLAGREVSKLWDKQQAAGRHTFTWNAVNQPAGIYLAVWKAGDVRKVEKLVLVR